MNPVDSTKNTYQLAGFDERDRGFTRQAIVARRGDHYQATLRYETLVVEGNPSETEPGSLQTLVLSLQVQGYTQIRAQLIFKGNLYLGSQEQWIEYSDPEQPRNLLQKFMSWIRSFFKSS